MYRTPAQNQKFMSVYQSTLKFVTDFSVETFYLAFRRFASHMFLPQILVSNNASTHIAAEEELQ